MSNSRRSRVVPSSVSDSVRSPSSSPSPPHELLPITDDIPTPTSSQRSLSSSAQRPSTLDLALSLDQEFTKFHIHQDTKKISHNSKKDPTNEFSRRVNNQKRSNNSRVAPPIPLTPRLIRPNTAESRALRSSLNPSFIIQTEQQIDCLIDFDICMELDHDEEKDYKDKKIKQTQGKNKEESALSAGRIDECSPGLSSESAEVHSLAEYLSIQEERNKEKTDEKMENSPSSLEDEAEFYRKLIKNAGNNRKTSNQIGKSNGTTGKLSSSSSVRPNPRLLSSTSSPSSSLSSSSSSMISSSPFSRLRTQLPYQSSSFLSSQASEEKTIKFPSINQTKP
jgi:hypothetical protein